MTNPDVYAWLIANGDAPTRYRVYRELLHQEDTAQEMEAALLEHPIVAYWLRMLKPQTPPQHHSMHHGSFDFNLENALLKAVQLGLHAALPPVRDAVGFYLDELHTHTGDTSHYRNRHTGFPRILSVNLLADAGFLDDVVMDALRKNLAEIHAFVHKGIYDIYLSDDEQKLLKGIPATFAGRPVIRPDLVDAYGFAYPLIYDIIGLHRLYDLNNPTSNQQIDDVISYITTDDFHSRIPDGYGILIAGNRRYHGMGWDPKYPGWGDVAQYMEHDNVPRLLFFAQYIAHYRHGAQSMWMQRLLAYLQRYETAAGIYCFPGEWLKEKPGYAVMGAHVSFGENRRKKNWREVESTLYMQLLQQRLNRSISSKT